MLNSTNRLFDYFVVVGPPEKYNSNSYKYYNNNHNA